MAAPDTSIARRALRAVGVVFLVLAMGLAGLVVLATAGLESGPVAFTLAVVLAVLPVPVWLALVLWIDRFEPEPVSMIALAFAWGATIAAFVALALNTIGELIVSDALGEDAAALYGYSISAPVVEEAAKGAVLFGLFRWKRHEFNGVLDGIVYAAMVGLGFAMTENILYYGRGAVEEGVVGAVATFVVRGLMSPFAHPVFTAMIGIGLGVAARTRLRGLRVAAPLLGLGGAMVLHSLWNTSAGAGLFFGVYLLIMVPVFVALVGVVAWERRRERRLVARMLGRELPAAEVTGLTSPATRRQVRREAHRRAGRRGARAVRDFQESATELAFLLHQREVGALRGAGAERRERELRERLAARRRELTGLLARG